MPTMNAQDLAARLDRLPPGRFHRRVLAALAFAFFFELGDLNTFAYVAPQLRDTMGLSVHQVAVITSAGFLGMFVGAVGGGRIADLLGRRRTLLLSVTWFSLFSLANAAAWDAPSVLAARLLTGVGLGAMTVIGITYLAETMPADRRGRMQSAVLATGLAGIPVMAFLARGVVPINDQTWRIVFAFGALGFLALVLIARLPESPRWLLEKGQHDVADRVLRELEEEVEAEHGVLPPLQAEPLVVEEHDAPLAALFRGRLLTRTVMLLGVWIFQTLGFYGFVAWVPTLLADHGFSLQDSLGFAALTTIGAVPGALFAWPISDRFHRKLPIVVVALVTAVCGLAYGSTFKVAAIVIFGFLVSFFIQCFAALLYTYTPELYPTRLRNSGSGLCYGVGRLANVVGPLIVSAIYGGLGYVSVFVYIAVCWVLVALLVATLGPASGQMRLEELEPESVTAP
jgi:MFS transporter, putative metabolite:H+ symporter